MLAGVFLSDWADGPLPSPVWDREADAYRVEVLLPASGRRFRTRHTMTATAASDWLRMLWRLPSVAPEAMETNPLWEEVKGGD